MNTSSQSELRTRMVARVVGPYITIIAATAAARTSDMRALIAAFDANSVWPWVTGAFVLLAGLAVVALHPYWRGAAAITVSLLGWLTVLKGLFLFVFPGTYMSVAASMIDATTWYRACLMVVALVGMYLSYVGWIPASSRLTSRAANSTVPDISRAA